MERLNVVLRCIDVWIMFHDMIPLLMLAERGNDDPCERHGSKEN
jgi:hypothetical protein